jgi:Trp operon repressor
MSKFSFDETMQRFDDMVTYMENIDAKNNVLFQQVCQEILRHSYSKLEFQNNLNTAITEITRAISAYVKPKKYTIVTAKSFRILNPQTAIVSYPVTDTDNV